MGKMRARESHNGAKNLDRVQMRVAKIVPGRRPNHSRVFLKHLTNRQADRRRKLGGAVYHIMYPVGLVHQGTMFNLDPALRRMHDEIARLRYLESTLCEPCGENGSCFLADIETREE